ncbi:THO2 plays a role in transcriptional elongation [Friedmanniomyces endolithicus]|nr:THO2 plays a role in transcriptional elongation [Friedmanniomyces endolithicus]
MAPGSANKRKRNDRLPQDDHNRASPHRPEELGMAQRMERDGGRGRGDRGSRRQSRQIAPADGVNAVPVAPRNALEPPAPQPPALQQTTTPAGEVSRTSTPLPRASTPAQPPQTQEPKEPRGPYAYECLSDEVVASWPSTGKDTVLGIAKEADETSLGTILQELVRSALDGRLDPGESGLVVKQLILERKDGDTLDAQSSFLSTISMLEDADTRNSALLVLLASTDIDPEVIRQDLDVPLLAALPLVRSTFDRMRTRKTTSSLYRQANFNLLREETEGYAKLLTEYFNIAEEANKAPTPDVAENAFHRIMALVGAFDLDVGRVLDITLDISANSLVKDYAFYIKFYRCSSWWPEGGNLDNVQWEDDGFNTFPAWALPGSCRLGPSEGVRTEHISSKQMRDKNFWSEVRSKGLNAFFELGMRKITNYDSIAEQLSADSQPALESRGKELTEDRRKRLNETRKHMRETRTLPAPGNSDAAQLLGFKLRFYASSARDALDVMPDNLIHFTALLIKIGFISLRDLYPHLHPADEKMSEERTRLETEKAEKEARDRPGGGPSKLAMASALTDDAQPYSSRLRADKDKGRSGGTTPKPETKDETPQEDLNPPLNQKIALLKALLALGAVSEAMYILGRFPWLVEADTSLPPYLLRLVRHMLSKVADSVRPLTERDGLMEGRDQSDDTVPKSNGSLSFRPRDVKPPTKWLGLEEISEENGQRYRYYYTEWADNVPVCQTMDDVFQLCNTLIGFLGVKIGRDTVILGTLIRLARRSLADEGSDTNRTRWLEVMRRLLVPALSLTKHNISLTEEMYQLLVLFPVTTRYNIYAEWFTGKTSRLPELKVAFEHNRAEVKDVLRRVSNENVKVQARALGKVSFSSPGVLMMFMISQLESYSNMIPALVECTKYFPKLAYDVLTWCLINSLSGQGRNRIQADGMLTSSWLQALSQFVAALFHHYASVNPSPILQYLAFELRSGDSTDLEMFEQVLTEMAGVRSDTEFNDAQVLAMAGGEQLQAHIMQQLADKRHERKSSAKRLIKALAEPSLIGQTLIAIAQERQMYSHHDSSSSMPLKVLCNNLDKIQSVFAQYLDVLRTNLKPEEFEAAVPDVVALVGEFGLQPGIAFAINRYVLGYRMQEAAKREDAQAKQRRASQESGQVNVDIEMQGGGTSSVSNGEPLTNGDPVASGDGKDQAVAQIDPVSSATSQSNGVESAKSPWHPALETLIERLPSVTGDLQHRVSISFFVTFWTLALPDVMLPSASYVTEVHRVQNEIKQLIRDRASTPVSSRLEHDRKRRALQDKQDKLANEKATRVSLRLKVSNRLKHVEKDHWFDRSRKREDMVQRHLALLQECFLPRAMLSSVDAQYSFVLLRTLHLLGTPGFSTLVIIQQLLRKQALAAIVFQFTGQEAQHFGRFLNEVLKMIAGWHASKDDFETHALGASKKLPGFVVGPMDYSVEGTWKFLDYESFRRLDSDWHHAILGSLLACFDSGEYMHIRNGIVVLKAIVGVYPQIQFHGNQLVGAVEKLSTEETRQDLKLMALSLLGPLKSREKQWVMPQAFRLNDPSKGGKPGSRAPSARPETPQPVADTPKLNATAAEFKPIPAVLPTASSRKGSVVGVEDGEVEDEQLAAAKGADTEMKDAPAPKADTTAMAAVPFKEQQSEQRPGPTPQPESKATPSAPVKDQQMLPSKPPTPAPSVAKPPTPVPPTVRSQAPVNGTGPNIPTSTLPPLPRGSQGPPSRPDSRGDYSNKPLPPTPVAFTDGRMPQGTNDGHGRLERYGGGRPGSREQSPGSRGRARSPPGMQRSHPRDERPRPAREEFGPHRRESANFIHNRPQDAHNHVNGSMGPPPVLNAALSRPGQLDSVVSVTATQPPSGIAPTGSSVPQAADEEKQFLVDNGRLKLIEEHKRRNARTEQSQVLTQAQSHSQSEDSRHREVRDHRDYRNDARNDRDSRSNGGMQPAEPSREPSARHEQQATELAPSGPRKGRLNSDFGREESSYGRLNAPPESVLVGPRPINGTNGSGGRDGRLSSAPQSIPRFNEHAVPSPTTSRPSPLVSRNSEHPAPSTIFSRPQEPAEFQPQNRPSHHQSFEPRNMASQMDQRQQQHSQAAAPSPSKVTDDLAGMNPERLKLFTNIGSSSAPPNQSSPASAPPSGPRAAAGRPPTNAPTGPSPATAAPPSGPASTVDRQRGRRQGGVINQALQQSTPASVAQSSRSQDVSFRGASSRQNSIAMSSAAAVTPVQAIAPQIDFQQRNHDAQPRNDGQSNRPDLRVGPRQDFPQHGQRAETRDDGRARRHEEERPRGSRHPSRERRPDDQPPQRAPPSGVNEGSNNRGAPRDDRRGRDEHDGSSRDLRSGPRAEDNRRAPTDVPTSMPGPSQNNFQQSGFGPESRRQGPAPADGRRGGLRSEDFRGGRREDDRRDGAGRGAVREDVQPNGDRKRRHEEQPFGPEKRRRSGR